MLAAWTMNLLAAVMMMRPTGDPERGFALFERANEIGERRGNVYLHAIGLGNMGLGADWQGNSEQAKVYHEQALGMMRQVGSPIGMALALNNLGIVECILGDYVHARRHLAECLVTAREHNLVVKLDATEGLGLCALGTGDMFRGVALLAATRNARAASGEVVHPADAKMQEQSLATARAVLGNEAFEQAYREGDSMSMEDAVDLALEAGGLSGSTVNDGRNNRSGVPE